MSPKKEIAREKNGFDVGSSSPMIPLPLSDRLPLSGDIEPVRNCGRRFDGGRETIGPYPGGRFAEMDRHVRAGGPQTSDGL